MRIKTKKQKRHIKMSVRKQIFILLFVCVCVLKKKWIVNVSWAFLIGLESQLMQFNKSKFTNEERKTHGYRNRNNNPTSENYWALDLLLQCCVIFWTHEFCVDILTCMQITTHWRWGNLLRPIEIEAFPNINYSSTTTVKSPDLNWIWVNI